MQEQNQEREAILAKLDDVQTKVEILMKCNLKNYTIGENNVACYVRTIQN